MDQYSYRKGDVTQFRDAGLALGRRDGIAILFSMNIMNGGYPGCTRWSVELPTDHHRRPGHL